MYNFSPIIVLAIAGSLCGFYMIYYLPSIIHLKCLYSKNCNKHRFTSEAGQSSLADNLMTDIDIKDDSRSPCELRDYSYMHRLVRVAMYVVVVVLGMVFLVITFYGLFV